MKTFNLEAIVTISIYTKVEAETLKEAIEISEGRSIEAYQWGMKDQCNEYWISDDYDGEPQCIRNDK